MQFWKSWFFFRWMSKLIVLKILEYNETDSFVQKKLFLRRLFISTRRLQYGHSCWNLSGEILELLFKMRKATSRIKSFEVKTTFVNCSSIILDNFLRTLPEVIRSKSKENNENESFPEKITSTNLLVWKGTKLFWQSFRELFGRKMIKFLARFPKKSVLIIFRKIIFTSKYPLDT